MLILQWGRILLIDLQNRATVEAQSTSDFPSEPPVHSNIRDRLRKWESENVTVLTPVTLNTFEILDKPSKGLLSNSAVRPQSNDFYLELEEEESDVKDDGPAVFEHDLVDVGLRRSFLVPGDMVELTYVGITNRCRVFSNVL